MLSAAADYDLPSYINLKPASAFVVKKELPDSSEDASRYFGGPGILERLSAGEFGVILESFAQQKNALKERLFMLLADAREEAVENHPGLVPLTPESERVCRRFSDWVVDKYFLKRGLKLVATAKLDGGATFVATYQSTARRVDIEFSPKGDAALVFMTDKVGRVISESFSWKRTDWNRYLTWLFQSQVSAKE